MDLCHQRPKRRSKKGLQPTALVHEAYLRLIGQQEVEWKNRSQFFGVAAQVMRRILLDYARKHKAEKRGGSVPRVSIDAALVFSPENSADLVAVDELLTRLASLDLQQARIVELRYFGGLSVEETAEFSAYRPPP